MTSQTHSGGCQCGAVRFRIEGALGDASVCHCRMCQKAFGSLFAPLVSIGAARLLWTRGAPARFRSSNYVERGFCEKCGTPLSYQAPDGIARAIGAFDQPERIVPVRQFGAEGKLSYTDRISDLPSHPTMDDIAAAPFLDRIVSCQHPDRDTEVWPQR